MNANEKIRLLILHQNRQEAERLISMLQNAGCYNRAQLVDHENAFLTLLQEQSWDLLLAHDQAQHLTPRAAIKHIRKLNKDIPAILLTENETSFAIVEGLKDGACDVVRVDEDQHLLLVIKRELENRTHRQQHRHADRRAHEAERHAQQLLDSSRYAIAYIQDGLFLYANEAFADRFNYESRDDLECMPVMDLIAEDDNEKVRLFLKDFTLSSSQSENNILTFTGVYQDGTSEKIEAEVTSSTFDDEDCIKLLIRSSGRGGQHSSPSSSAAIDVHASKDPVTHLFNRQYILDQLERSIDKAINQGVNSALLFFDVDDYYQRIQSAMGMVETDIVIKNIADYLKSLCKDTEILARFNDRAFILFAEGMNADTAIERANVICQRVESHIIEVKDKTLQLTVSAGVALISETATHAEDIIDQAASAAASARNSQQNQKKQSGPAVQIFETEEQEEGSAHDLVINAILAALDKGRFRLLFQPVISLRGDHNEHYEVLLRMLDVNNVEVSPAQFLEAAARIGATPKIDRWVVLESIKALVKHHKQGNKARLMVNLSNESFCDESFLPWLTTALKKAQVPSQELIFQLSEYDVTNHLNAAIKFVNGLEKLNSHCSIRNFGCSLNPFQTLNQLSAQYIKVDGSFVSDIQNKNEEPKVLINLLNKLHENEKISIVPFVENATILSTLWQAGAHYIQGHYLQAPAQQMDYDFTMEG